ncbi:hypothetical protein BC827DRAFT_958397 [Russula dissimulans]|nr:hypothetical protein BC827DRAFT_958397 [Russula dissimulans]
MYLRTSNPSARIPDEVHTSPVAKHLVSPHMPSCPGVWRHAPAEPNLAAVSALVAQCRQTPYVEYQAGQPPHYNRTSIPERPIWLSFLCRTEHGYLRALSLTTSVKVWTSVYMSVSQVLSIPRKRRCPGFQWDENDSCCLSILVLTL